MQMEKNMTKKNILTTLTMLICLTLLWGCWRVYPDGHKEEIGPVKKTVDILIGKPDRPGNAPDEGLMPVIVSILGTLDVYGVGHLMDRKRLHRLRAEAEQETDLLRAGYQEIKEGHRGDEDSLTKVKKLFALGQKIYGETIQNKKDVEKDVESFRSDYKEFRAGHKAIDKT